MLIAEDLLLLLTDDRTGKLAALSAQVDIALGGAMLIELTLSHRVDLAGPTESVREGRLVVRDGSTTADTLLDRALAQVDERQGKKPKDVVSVLGKGLRGRLYARLAEQGILRSASGKVLGVFPTHRWPASDAVHESSVRALLADALRLGTADDPRVGALVSLLHALKAVDKVLEPVAVGITKKELKANAKRIAEADWGSQAVRRAIDEMLAVVIAAAAASGGA
ncbi:MAG: GOLPH3/VPS74 family protein [Gaiellaceae bacterium]